MCIRDSPRGYRPFQGFETILKRIENGIGIAPKPYKIVDMDSKEIPVSYTHLVHTIQKQENGQLEHY